MAEAGHALSEVERRRFAVVVSKAWSDEAFADRYRNEPMAVLAEHGIAYAGGFPPPVPAMPTGPLSLEGLGPATVVADGGPPHVPSLSCIYVCGN